MTTPANTPLPTGSFTEAVRISCKKARIQAKIEIRPESIERFLRSPALAQNFSRLKLDHGVALPLKFPSVVSEVNLLAILSLLNFASGYRVPLHEHSGRGAYDTIRAFVFGLFLSSSDSYTSDNLLCAAGMKTLTRERVAGLAQLPMHVERVHPTLPGVTIAELGGPLLELIDLISRTMIETGEILTQQGYHDLGHFIIEALQEAKRDGDLKGLSPSADIVVERAVRAFPAFRDIWMVDDNEPVYIFKKALFLVHALNTRFGPNSARAGGAHNLPIPDTSQLPIFADNVIPSMLVHLGVIDLSACEREALQTAFPPNPEALERLLGASTEDKTVTAEEQKRKQPPKDGPHLTHGDAYILRAAAVDACEMIVAAAHDIGVREQGDSSEFKWLSTVTLPDFDGWLWAVAKDRRDYRALPRFVERDTVFF